MKMFHRLAWFMFLVLLLGAGRTANAEPPEDSPAVDGSEVARLIEQLGHDRYVMREHAQAKLEELGPATFDALTEALEHDDLEIANRANYLLGKIRFDWTSSRDSKRIQNLLKDYATRDEEQRIAVIEQLAEHGRDEDLRVLSRIAQYDRSHRVSKRAALAMMFQWSPTQDIARRKTTLILKQLGDTQRPAATWYRAFAEARSDNNSAEGIAKLQAIANTERGKTGTTQSRTGPGVVARLFYLVAHLQAASGDATAAQKNAEQALAAGGDSAQERLLFVPDLRQRGHIDWAEKEYLRVLELEPGNSFIGISAYRMLSDMYHDQGRAKEAADTLQRLIEFLEKQPRVQRFPNARVQATGIRAQMNYLYSLHYEKLGDTAKQTAAIEKAVQQSQDNPDILIALYRLPNRTLQQRQQTEALIGGTIRRFRTEMNDSARSGEAAGQNHNQFAWLVGNTLGETDAKLGDEAIDASHRSLELSPNSFAYTDTLARCYYARGKLDEAIKYQKQALALNPYSGLLQSQLKFFEKKLAETKASSE